MPFTNISLRLHCVWLLSFALHSVHPVFQFCSFLNKLATTSTNLLTVNIALNWIQKCPKIRFVPPDIVIFTFAVFHLSWSIWITLFFWFNSRLQCYKFPIQFQSKGWFQTAFSIIFNYSFSFLLQRLLPRFWSVLPPQGICKILQSMLEGSNIARPHKLG